MVSDPSENEPDEPDPEAEFRDPDSDSLTIPKVSTEDAGSGLRSDLASEIGNEDVDLDVSVGESDVPSELQTAFWALVLVINAAVLAYSLGLMFLFFRGETTYAAYLVGAGLVLTGFAVRRYRKVQRMDFSSADDPDATDETDAGDDPEATSETDDGDASDDHDATDSGAETTGESADGVDVSEPSDPEN